jgi:hypothetical protein
MRLRQADCRRGRTRFEGGRYRRDGSPATESVRSTRRGDTTMRCPTIRLYETTTTTISAAFFAAKALRFSWTKASFSPHTMR